MKLLDHHREQLQARGLTDHTIERAGIYSLDAPAKLQMLLGWKASKKCVPAIVIPFTRMDGSNGYARVRPDNPPKIRGKAAKYLSPSRVPSEVYIPPDTFAALDDPQVDLVITESEFKSLAADQLGQPCLGLVGVHGWKSKNNERLLPAFDHIAWHGRKVFIAYDAPDTTDNPLVQDAESRLAAHLANRGAVVKVIRIPAGPMGADGKPTKMGLDDYLAASGADARKNLVKLIAEASPPADVDAATMKLPATDLDPAAEVKVYLATGEVDGVSRLRFWRGEYRLYAHGSYRALPRDEVRAFLVKHLNEGYRKLTTPIVVNCLEQLRAQSLLPSTIEAPAWLDAAPADWPPQEMLVCKNALIHLPSLVAGKPCSLEATPRLFSLSAMPFDFEPNPPKPPEWFAFLAKLWGEDSASVEMLQEWFGYSLLEDTSQQKILLLVGPKRSGKGTVARVLTGLVGQANVCNPTLSSLATNFGLWPLIGKRLAIIGDARLGGRSDIAAITEKLLSISGEDDQTVDRKMLEPWTGKLRVRFVVITNKLPKLTDDSGALPSRFLILRFSKSWYGAEDRKLTNKLLAELPGILKWAIVGWGRLNQRGHFLEPKSSDSLRDQMNDLASPIGAFIRQECVLGPNEWVVRKELHTAYVAYREAAGAKHIEDAPEFGTALHAAVQELESKKKRIEGKQERVYVGIRLKTDAEKADEEKAPDE
jgi:putative DNA primase/helicase